MARQRFSELEERNRTSHFYTSEKLSDLSDIFHHNYVKNILASTQGTRPELEVLKEALDVYRNVEHPDVNFLKGIKLSHELYRMESEINMHPQNEQELRQAMNQLEHFTRSSKQIYEQYPVLREFLPIPTTGYFRSLGEQIQAKLRGR